MSARVVLAWLNALGPVALTVVLALVYVGAREGLLYLRMRRARTEGERVLKQLERSIETVKAAAAAEEHLFVFVRHDDTTPWAKARLFCILCRMTRPLTALEVASMEAFDAQVHAGEVPGVVMPDMVTDISVRRPTRGRADN